MTGQDLQPVLERVTASAQTALPPAFRADFADFVRTLYRHVSAADIANEPEALHLARVTGFWQWGQTCDTADTLKVRVHNPTGVANDWRQGGTFIEIITPDMPFLVDSVTAELARLGIAVTRLQHPVFAVTRDADGTLQTLRPATRTNGEQGRESWIHLTAERQSIESLDGLRALLLRVLADVRLAVTDWQDMRHALRTATTRIAQEAPPDLSPHDVLESARFCEWLDADHFLFLGYRDYTLSADGARLVPDLSAARGLLRDSDLIVLRGLQEFDSLPEDVQRYLRHPEVLFVNKAQAKSSVHRVAPYDLIGVRRFHPDGRLAGLRLFLGLFTSLAYSTIAQEVPWLRQKVARMLDRSGCDPRGHNGKALTHILNNYPRDDIFLIDEDNLFTISQGILMLADRIRTALFVWTDPFQRFVSCLVYTPRDRFDTDLRKALIAVLEEGFGATSHTFSIDITDSPLVRLRVLLTLPPQASAPDLKELERRLVETARGWDDRVTDALVTHHGMEQGLALRARYADAFPALYRGMVAPERAASDIVCIESVLVDRPMALSLHALPDRETAVQIRLFHRGQPLALSDIVPRLENMGLRIISEVPYRVTPRDNGVVWISELLAESRSGIALRDDTAHHRFVEAFRRLWDQSMVDDAFNRLIIHPGLVWRDVALLRAYARYLQQVGFVLSYAFICDTLVAHPHLTARLVQLFHTLFDPARQTAGAADALRADIEAGLEAVTNPAEDEVLRRYLNLITATLRTNFYQRTPQGHTKPYLAFKLDSQALTDLPLPRPLVEIWVYGPRVEGIHLRGGRVARGGLRWSDRRDDFRTEVLGLMKAQMVKNAVIVPVGSKGGFYCKKLPTDRDGEKQEVIACYQTFIRGLLDLTDNRVGAAIVPPPDVVRRDGDDPYLVVAADKGTAKFSDIANALSQEYGFWLGDAFASGGSAGYDHKGMGITARGAWESVKRHFRERGHDVQLQPFTCVGVGDMAGDVFGNGLLRSPVTLLVGAFNHKHIFLDPNPDPAAGFVERKRLFDLPGSQWSDYDPAKLSKGGGVYERSAKTIPLSPEVRARFGLSGEKIPPNDLIRALLRADVDLLYLGGIGTYVKASDETHPEVNDKANDPVRISARDIRARVVGEGANLGFTARARIEYARAGGAINSDAIDNSGGVDTSDHEVNFKIALQPALADGTLTPDARNSLLAAMTDEVAALVLQDNYLQPQALSLEHRHGPALLEAHARLIHTWEKTGRLDRAVEFLPTEEQIAQRAQTGEGLSRPELAILLAHAKLALCDELVHSALPDSTAVEADLMGYFPKALQTRFADAIRTHRLRREIVATVLANDLVNRMGPTFAQGLAERTGHSPVDVVRAYLVVRHVFDLNDFWRDVEILDNRIPAPLQLELLGRSQSFVARTVSAVLQMAPRPIDIVGMNADLAPSLAALAAQSGTILPAPAKQRMKQARQDLLQNGVPDELAARASLLEFLASGPDILVVAHATGRDPAEAAAVYYAVGQRFTLDELRAHAHTLKVANHWQRQESLALAEDLFAWQQKLAIRILAQANGQIPVWESANASQLARCDALLGEAHATPTFDLSMLAMIGRSLRNLAGP